MIPFEPQSLSWLLPYLKLELFLLLILGLVAEPLALVQVPLAIVP